MEVLKSWGFVWEWVYDKETGYAPNEAYTALFKTENERYYVILRFPMRFAHAYEFSQVDKMRAIKHYNEFKNLLKTEYELRKKDETKVIYDIDNELTTPTLYSLGYQEYEDKQHPKIDTKPIEQVYIEDGCSTSINLNRAIYIPPQKIHVKTVEQEETKIEHKDCREYEQMNLFIKC